jgi:hypothetical protein
VANGESTLWLKIFGPLNALMAGLFYYQNVQVSNLRDCVAKHGEAIEVLKSQRRDLANDVGEIKADVKELLKRR